MKITSLKYIKRSKKKLMQNINEFVNFEVKKQLRMFSYVMFLALYCFQVFQDFLHSF